MRRFAAWLATEGELPAGPLARRAFQPLGYDGLYRSLAKRARAAGIRDFHPHMLGHTAASRWLAAGSSEGGS